MERFSGEKDKNPYLIFRCSKCKQYLFAKITQKTKKCLRCGRTHLVKNILNSGEIVNGITNALKNVKDKQNILAVKELGDNPDLRTPKDFCVVGNINNRFEINPKTTKIKELERDLSQNFKNLIFKLSETYKKFPSYMIETMAEDYRIPNSELKILINKFKKNGMLISLKNNYYTVNINRKVEE